MSEGESKKWLGIVGRTLLAYALVFATGASAGPNQSPQDRAVSRQEAAAQRKASAAAPTKTPAEVEESESAVGQEKNSGDGKHEGIKVHGHWTIEVRNPDGSLATHREFENSLVLGVTGGSGFLSNVLARASAVGSYEIQLTGATINSGGTQSTVFIDEAGTPAATSSGSNCALGPSFSSCSTNLTVTDANGALTLAASAVPPPGFGANVNSVSTFVQTCNPTSTPQSCPSASAVKAYGFTNRFLDGLNGNPQPVPVSPGQTVAVTVVISFS